MAFPSSLLTWAGSDARETSSQSWSRIFQRHVVTRSRASGGYEGKDADFGASTWGRSCGCTVAS
jgi:hypothetical protein